MEFIITSKFPVENKAGGDLGHQECRDKCWQKVHQYREDRWDYHQGPAAHHSCNLGWLWFSWKSEAVAVPEAMEKHDGRKDIYSRIDKVVNAHKKKSDGWISQLLLRELIRKLVSSVLTAGFEKFTGIRQSPMNVPNTRGGTCAVSGRASGSDMWTCSSSSRLLWNAQDTVVDSLTDILYGWYDRLSRDPKAKSPPIPPSECRCDIGIVVERFYTHPKCSTEIFAFEFTAEASWPFRVPEGQQGIIRVGPEEVFPPPRFDEDWSNLDIIGMRAFPPVREETGFAKLDLERSNLPRPDLGQLDTQHKGMLLPVTEHAKNWFKDHTDRKGWVQGGDSPFNYHHKATSEPPGPYHADVML
ncbi:hypothetical protein BCR37DRAFT_193415 [Protomyces lactucae-debilis]|uniref:Uncharacterized protein n=1 Tax=Protomyces lactucae-debilis TaxID=2754530 RepID=A0A1Y2EUB0_PROLT|nr:uncharacterized protein BCR37DRAFT_193415 [Protomyces lactucae-debilis]ORY75107.1 hypothetical protein BCR37DRAFT_193415 [Protomyces lactucae-debilis]